MTIPAVPPKRKPTVPDEDVSGTVQTPLDVYTKQDNEMVIALMQRDIRTTSRANLGRRGDGVGQGTRGHLWRSMALVHLTSSIHHPSRSKHAEKEKLDVLCHGNTE